MKQARTEDAAKRLRAAVAARKIALRHATQPDAADARSDALRQHGSVSVPRQLFSIVRLNPVTSAAVVFGIAGALGPWGAVRLASRAVGLVTVASRVLPRGSNPGRD